MNSEVGTPLEPAKTRAFTVGRLGEILAFVAVSTFVAMLLLQPG
jgi:hypothetical protein